MATFMFCTGIENSVSTLDGGRTRIDVMPGQAVAEQAHAQQQRARRLLNQPASAPSVQEESR